MQNKGSAKISNQKISPILYEAESPKSLYALRNPAWTILKNKNFNS